MIRLRSGRMFEQKDINKILTNKINDAYEKLLEASNVLYEIHKLIKDEELSDVAYDLYLNTKGLANSVPDELRSLL